MADTGAPWNLPYPLPTDLVRDGAQAIQDLAEATATGLSNIPVLAGIGSNVVQTVKTDVFTTSSGSFTNVTGLTVTITPSSATSKVLLIGSLQFSYGGSTGDQSAVWRIAGGGTDNYRGDAAGTRPRGVGSQGVFGSTYNSTLAMMPGPIAFLDSPTTTGAITYSVQVLTTNTGNTVTVNRTSFDADARYGRGASSLIAIEVAA